MIAEGAGVVMGQARLEKSTDCCHVACMMKEMMRKEEKKQTEGLTAIAVSQNRKHVSQVRKKVVVTTARYLGR